MLAAMEGEEVEEDRLERRLHQQQRGLRLRLWGGLDNEEGGEDQDCPMHLHILLENIFAAVNVPECNRPC